MQKQTILASAIVILLFGVGMNHAFAATSDPPNTSVRVNNENANEVQTNIHNLLTASIMNHKAADNLQKYIEQQQKQHRDLEKKYAVDMGTIQIWENSKTLLAKQLSSAELEKRTNYVQSTSGEDKKLLFHLIETNHSTRINIGDAAKVIATNVSYHK